MKQKRNLDLRKRKQLFHSTIDGVGIQILCRINEKTDHIGIYTQFTKVSDGNKRTKKLNLPADEISKKYLSGISANKIAKEYGCSPSVIFERLRDNNIIIRSKIELPIDEISKKYLNGLSTSEIALEYKCSNVTILKRLYDNNIKIRSAGQQSLILPEIEICEKYLSGMSTMEIMKEYKCKSATTINKILRNNNIVIRSGGGQPLILPEIEICEKYLNGMNTTELGIKYKCSPGLITKRLHDNGINVQKERAKHTSVTKLGITYNEWNGFACDRRYCILFNIKFKERIRNNYNNRCYLCGKTEEENGQKLDVHHVNYNKNCLCGLLCEFVPLCKSCHSKTNFNRKYWEDLIMYYLYPDRYFIIDL